MSLILRKGDAIPIEHDAVTGEARVIMGLGWDPIAEPVGPVDLDGSCLLFDAQRELVDAVGFNQLRSQCGRIVHTGDNVTGEGHSDDEQILINLSQLPQRVETLVFVISSFSGHDFLSIDNVACRLIDVARQREIARYCLCCQGPHTGQIMARVSRHDDGWRMHAVGESCGGLSYAQMLPEVLLRL